MKVRTGLVLALILVLVFSPVRRGQGYCRHARPGAAFRGSPGWELEVKTVRSERFLCLDTNPAFGGLFEGRAALIVEPGVPHIGGVGPEPSAGQGVR